MKNQPKTSSPISRSFSISAALLVGLLAACGDDEPSNNSGADVGLDSSMEDTSMTDTSMEDTSMTDTSMEDTSMTDTSMEDTTTTPGTIPEVAVAAGTFTTLVDAVVATGLADALSGEGPLTVFAPTDDAFAALPEGTLEGLTTEQLTDILLYHVVDDSLLAADVVASKFHPSLLGPYIEIDADAGTAGGATLSATDVLASNGVIHVLDGVMMPPADIPTIATESDDFESLVGALVRVGLVDALTAEGPFTVFAPSDDAFAALPAGTVEGLSDDELSDILQYHVYPGFVEAADITDGAELTMLNGDVLTFAITDGVPSVGGAGFLATDVLAYNGLIHIVDGVLLPPLGNIAEIATENGNFTTLVDALVATDLVGALSGEGPFTVFAPTDAAFAALPDGTLEGLTTEQLTDILLYHVVDEALLSGEVVASKFLPTLLGTWLEVDAVAGTVGGAPLSTTDIMASNGIIHVIDAVIQPPADIPTIASGSDDFESLVAALVRVGLVDALTAEGPFTVFAPTDAAFAALPDGTVEGLTDAELSNILQYHVYAGLVQAADITDGAELTMLNGDTLTFAITDGTPTVGGADFVATDVLALNGLIHIVDGVLLPE